MKERELESLKKRVELNERDLSVFRFLSKYRVAKRMAVMSGCGFANMENAHRRMKKLCNYGYLKAHKMYYECPYVYTVTAKGLREIEDKGKPYKPSPATVLHYVGVADCAAWLAGKYGLDPVRDFYSDKDFYHNEEVIDQYQLQTSHKPDLIFIHRETTYFVEYERTRKRRKLIMENILMNHLSGVKQIWVLDGLPFGDIKKECGEDSHYQKAVNFLDYVEIACNASRRP